jgi:hypothetical protein
VSGVAGLLLALVASAGSATGQDKPEAPTPKTTVPLESRAAREQSRWDSSSSATQEDENPKRILGIIPNFQTTNDTPVEQEPLTVKEKYVLAWHQSVDISAHFGNAFQAALQQASNGQPHYGQGWGPYAQRFGAAEADQLTSSFFIFGFLPHVLKIRATFERPGLRPGVAFVMRLRGR